MNSVVCFCGLTITTNMPKKYSEDLRWRIVFQVCLQGKTIEQVAHDTYVSHSSVERFVHLFHTTGDVTSLQQKHGPNRKLSEFEELTVLQSFLNKPGIYLSEVQEDLFDITGTWVDIATICRTAKRLGLRRQKMKKVADRRSDVLRACYMVEIEEFHPDMLVFIDETGCERRNLVRKYGYGLRGIPPVSHQLLVYGKRVSAIGVITTRGVEDAYLVDGNVNGKIFLDFVQRCLLDVIQPFDGNNPRSVVVLDNASIHHLETVVDLIEAAGALVQFLPPYSPDLNPIEELFSQVKSYLREHEQSYQGSSEPRVLISSAFASVTPQQCENYIRHAGYME